MKCDICKEDCTSIFKAKHRELGRVKICMNCWKEELPNLLPTCGCSCCE